MKLIVKRMEVPTAPGGYAYTLCDESGEMLPMQTRCVVDCGVSHADISVEFKIDGEFVRLDG